MLSRFKSAPILPVTKSEEEINKDYKYWRLHVMASIWVGYAIFYFTRNSYKSVMPTLMTDLGFTRLDLGILSTIFYIVYGSSRFVGGMISDKSNPRYFMGIGLIFTGIINILFGFSSSLVSLALLWGLNAFFQGWGWPPCTKILTTWYSRNERGFWWALCNTSHNVGGALIPLLAGFFAVNYGWRYGMIVPGCIGIVVGILICIFLRDRPESMGLPKVGEWRKDELEMEQVKKSSSNLGTWEILTKYVFTNKYIWLLALSYVLVYVVRIGLNDWASSFIMSTYHVDNLKANSPIATFEVGGFIGTIVAGWGSDKLFKGNRIPMNIIFMVGIMISIFILWKVTLGFTAMSVLFFLIGFFIFGPQMLSGMAAAEVCHKDFAGTATGFLGLFGYMGAAMSGAPIGKLIDSYTVAGTINWTPFFIVMLTASIFSAVIIFPILKPKKV